MRALKCSDFLSWSRLLVFPIYKNRHNPSNWPCILYGENWPKKMDKIWLPLPFRDKLIILRRSIYNIFRCELKDLEQHGSFTSPNNSQSAHYKTWKDNPVFLKVSLSITFCVKKLLSSWSPVDVPQVAPPRAETLVGDSAPRHKYPQGKSPLLGTYPQPQSRLCTLLMLRMRWII